MERVENEQFPKGFFELGVFCKATALDVLVPVESSRSQEPGLAHLVFVGNVGEHEFQTQTLGAIFVYLPKLQSIYGVVKIFIIVRLTCSIL